MVTYKCEKCNFSIVKDHNPGKCPYCGKGNLSERPSAQDFLDEALSGYKDIED